MQMNVKKLVGAIAIAGTLGLPGLILGAGAANAATPAPSIPVPVDSVQTQPVDWGGDGHGDGGDWRHRGDWDRGGWGDRGGDWGRGGWGGWGWGWGR